MLGGERVIDCLRGREFGELPNTEAMLLVCVLGLPDSDGVDWLRDVEVLLLLLLLFMRMLRGADEVDADRDEAVLSPRRGDGTVCSANDTAPLIPARFPTSYRADVCLRGLIGLCGVDRRAGRGDPIRDATTTDSACVALIAELAACVPVQSRGRTRTVIRRTVQQVQSSCLLIVECEGSAPLRATPPPRLSFSAS